MYQNIAYHKKTGTMHVWDDELGHKTFNFKPYAYIPAVTSKYQSLDGDEIMFAPPKEIETTVFSSIPDHLRMKNRKQKRLAKFTKNRENKRKNTEWCPCCGRSRNDYSIPIFRLQLLFRGTVSSSFLCVEK